MEFLHFTLVDLVDIILVAAVIFLIYRWIRGSSAINIFIAIIILFIVRVIATAMNMKMVSAMLGTILDVGAIAIIVIFQPEIRRFLNNIGRTAGQNNVMKKFFRRQQAEGLDSGLISEIVLAVEQMAATKTGALIVVRRRDNLQSIIATGDLIDARVSQRLVMNIFFKNSPLHDGAMIIVGDRIEAARCQLPMTARRDIPAHYGMRHRAALGVTEDTDADVIVVSEETGNVSYVHGGEIRTIKNIEELRAIVGKTLSAKEEA